jgi:hypothetical protein
MPIPTSVLITDAEQPASRITFAKRSFQAHQ